MAETNVPVKLSELREGYDYASIGMELDAQAYVGLDTGKVYFRGDGMPEEENLPEEVEDSGRFVPVPHKYDLDLGKHLVFDFVHRELLDDADRVHDLFRRRGAYSRFKDLLVRRGKLDRWHEYEDRVTDQRLREWCEAHEIAFIDDRPGISALPEPGSMYIPVNFDEKFTRFKDRWSPKIVAQMNDYHFKLVKIEGEFVWHSHADTDEAFIVLDGEMTIRFRDGEVTLRPGEMYVVPKGIEHNPVAVKECQIMLIEKAGTVNTGDANSKLTAPDDAWI